MEFLGLTKSDGDQVLIDVDSIEVIEEGAASGGWNCHCTIYAAGEQFEVQEEIDEVKSLLGNLEEKVVVHFVSPEEEPTPEEE